MPFCTNCGESIQDSANFCVKCGTATRVNGRIPNSTALATSERLVKKGADAASSKLESSELKNVKAVIYVAVLFVFYLGSAVCFSNSPSAARINVILKAQLSAAVAAWIISKMLPDGWLTTSRSLLYAIVINGAIVGCVLFASD